LGSAHVVRNVQSLQVATARDDERHVGHVVASEDVEVAQAQAARCDSVDVGVAHVRAIAQLELAQRRAFANERPYADDVVALAQVEVRECQLLCADVCRGRVRHLDVAHIARDHAQVTEVHTPLKKGREATFAHSRAPSHVDVLEHRAVSCERAHTGVSHTVAEGDRHVPKLHTPSECVEAGVVQSRALAHFEVCERAARRKRLREGRRREHDALLNLEARQSRARATDGAYIVVAHREIMVAA